MFELLKRKRKLIIIVVAVSIPIIISLVYLLTLFSLFSKFATYSKYASSNGYTRYYGHRPEGVDVYYSIQSNPRCTLDKVYTDLEKALEEPEKVICLDLASETTVVNENIFAKIATLKNLKDLRFHRFENKMMGIPFEISGLNQLEVIEFEKTNIGKFSENSKLPKLTDLYIEFSEPLSLPEGISNIGNIKTLRLENINSFKGLESLNLLTTLQISYTLYGMKKPLFPEEVNYLTNLDNLYISGNNLNDMPASLVNLKKLKSLNLSYNPIKNLSPNIGQLSNLEVLMLTGNTGVTLPSEIANLSNLKVLGLTDTELSNSERERISKLLPKTDISFFTEFH